MKIMQNLFIHTFVCFTHEYHALKTCMTHVYVLTNEVRTYE
jgi:hypothetical protein